MYIFARDKGVLYGEEDGVCSRCGTAPVRYGGTPADEPPDMCVDVYVGRDASGVPPPTPVQTLIIGEMVNGIGL